MLESCKTIPRSKKMTPVHFNFLFSLTGGYLASFHSAEEVEKLTKHMAIPYTFYVPSMHIGLGKRKDGMVGFYFK